VQWSWRGGGVGLPFRDRRDAGKRLAEKLAAADLPLDAVVLGIPRGGVVVAAEVARDLDRELDVVVAHKLGAPGNPEYAIGAVTADGTVLLEPWAHAEADEAHIQAEIRDQVRRARDREAVLRRGRPAIPLRGRTAVIVDDGIATGATVRVAVQAARAAGAARVVVAAPVAPSESVERLAASADEVVVVATPDLFFALSQFYERFEQVEDAEVASLLGSTPRRPPAVPGAEGHEA